MLKGSGDEGMLTRAPPDHQATCFNIHDITSSLGGAGLHKDEAARSRLLLLAEESASLSAMIGCSLLQFDIHLLSSFLIDFECKDWTCEYIGCKNSYPSIPRQSTA